MVTHPDVTKVTEYILKINSLNQLLDATSHRFVVFTVDGGGVRMKYKTGTIRFSLYMGQLCVNHWWYTSA